MATVTITAQYKENYGAHDWDGEGTCPQYWKNKGGHRFVVELTSQEIMYASNLMQVCRDFCLSQNTDYENFEYRSHEVEFTRPTLVNSDFFIKNLE